MLPNANQVCRCRSSGREGLVLKAVRHLAAHVAVGQRLTGRDKVGLDSLVIAPHDLFQRAAPGSVQAFGNRLAAGPGHAHGVEKQNGGFGLIAHCGKKHRFSTSPLLCGFFQQNNFI